MAKDNRKDQIFEHMKEIWKIAKDIDPSIQHVSMCIIDHPEETYLSVYATCRYAETISNIVDFSIFEQKEKSRR